MPRCTRHSLNKEVLIIGQCLQCFAVLGKLKSIYEAPFSRAFQSRVHP